LSSTTDRIEKRIVLRAPQERVWRAVSDAAEFGRWFGMEVDGAFVAGASTRGRITPTAVDGDVAKVQEKYRGVPFELFVERVEPMSVFAFRWHPHATDPSVDYSREPMTLVTFFLEPLEDGTAVTITESGFDSIPIERRATAFEANSGGWETVAQLLDKYMASRQP